MSTRGRPRQFSLDAVIDAALELVEEQGAQGLSMHALARRLGTGSATLYTYVGSRDELIDMMLGRSLAGQPALPVATTLEEWGDGLVDYLVALFADGVARPALLELSLQRPPTHIGATALAEQELAMLQAVGFSLERAAEVHRMLSSQALGHNRHAVLFTTQAVTAPEGSTLGAAQRHLRALGEVEIYERALRALVGSLVAELQVAQLAG